MSDDDELN